ncbi:hypothetical protein [Halostagnicola sp. A-GB9-2]|uniref:hypothetical protein n=1 Tax=Halostagnicola sp. A-GB9-2 TaxID=3048066 RepID=UPI0024BFCE7C|nr:hypothetical protein [Halostagnicola sp. A-GB9-2]MDJ1433521.1 hypothetical protein [Halostagnicola sp. A-GB9-2]
MELNTNDHGKRELDWGAVSNSTSSAPDPKTVLELGERSVRLERTEVHRWD